MALEQELRNAQLANYKAGLKKAVDEGKPKPIIADRSDGSKNYSALAKVWMPLILDHPDSETPSATPWTVEEVLKAMRPIVRKFANEYGGHKAGYQYDDALSDGNNAVLSALSKDGGRAPFALFAAQTVKRAIQKGLKGSNIIPVVTRRQTYTDRGMTSLDQPADADAKFSVGSNVGSDAPYVSKVKCPHCGGSGAVDDETCPVCNGDRYIKVADKSRSKIPQPDESLFDAKKLSKARGIISDLIIRAGLSPRQTEVFLLKHGLEGIYDPSLTSTGEDRHPTAISRILSFADTIHRLPPPGSEGHVSESGLWPEAVKQGKEHIFQRLWSEAFGDIDHKKYDPDLPASLQIVPLFEIYDEGNAVDRLTDMINKMNDQIAPVELKFKSKQLVVNQLKNANKKIEDVKGDLKTIDPYESNNNYSNLYKYCNALLGLYQSSVNNDFLNNAITYDEYSILL